MHKIKCSKMKCSKIKCPKTLQGQTNFARHKCNKFGFGLISAVYKQIVSKGHVYSQAQRDPKLVNHLLNSSCFRNKYRYEKY